MLKNMHVVRDVKLNPFLAPNKEHRLIMDNPTHTRELGFDACVRSLIPLRAAYEADTVSEP